MTAHDYPFIIRHLDGSRSDFPSAQDAEIYIPRGGAGNLAELIAKADAFDRIVEARQADRRPGGESAMLFRERASRIMRQTQTNLIDSHLSAADAMPRLSIEPEPQVIADAR